MKQIHHKNTLIYYDGIQVFDAQDDIGGGYIGILVDTAESDHDHYLVVGIAPVQLQRLRLAEIDLRAAIIGRPETEWFLASAPAGREAEGTLELEARTGDIPDEYLPGTGLFLGAHDAGPPCSAFNEARSRNTVALELSIESPMPSEQHRVPLGLLTGVLGNFGSLLKHAYDRARQGTPGPGASARRSDWRRIFDVAVPAIPGSVKVLLLASESPGLFGQTGVAAALEIVDKLAATASDPGNAIQIVKEFQGHTAGAFLRLVQFAAESEISLAYTWASPDRADVSSASISRPQAAALAQVLVSSEKLGTEVKTLTGTLRKVDADKGGWRLKSHTDGEEYSGKIGAGVSLSKVIIDSEYTFICEETTEFAIASGKETQKLVLTILRENH